MYTAIARNKRNTWFILLAFIAFLGAVGLLAGWLMGNNWWVTAFILIFAAGYAAFQYFFADKEALAMSGAVEVGRDGCPALLPARREPVHRHRHADAEALRRR